VFKQIEPTLVLVCKAAFADRNPAENYGHRAAQQSCEEHDFDEAHREYRQSKSHDWTLLFGTESIELSRSSSLLTVQRESRPELVMGLIAVNQEHSYPSNAASPMH